MATYNKTQLSNDPHLLLKDLFRVGDFGQWAAPKYKENIEWILTKVHEATPEIDLSKFNIRHQFLPKYLSIFLERIDFLITKGADIKPHCYQIANINNPEILSYCLDLGANPNIYNEKKNLPIIRAIDRKRSTIVKILLEHPSFDFDFHFSPGSENQKNVFSNLFDSQSTIVLNKVLTINPVLYLAKDNIDNTIFHYLNKLELEKSKSTAVKTLLANSLGYFKQNSINYDRNQPNKYNHTITNELLINGLTELNYYLMSAELPSNNSINNKPIVKL